MNQSLLNKLIEEERSFQQSEFIAPVFSNQVNVRVAGIIQQLSVAPINNFGVFKVNGKSAIFVRNTTLSEKIRYLQALPRLIFIISSIERGSGLLFINDGRFKIVGEVPIKLLDNVQLFDIIDVRFDGFNFIYERQNRNVGGIHCNVIRQYLTENKSTKLVSSKFQEAYTIAITDKKAKILETVEGRLTAYTERANAKLVGYRERNDGYSVEFTVDGERYTSTVNKNFRVVSAGICLSGYDANFDLQSLVTVIREGQNRNLIHRVNAR